MHRLVVVNARGKPLDNGALISCSEFNKLILASKANERLEKFIINSVSEYLGEEKVTHSRGKNTKVEIADVWSGDFSHPEFAFAKVSIQFGRKDQPIVSASGYAKRHPEDKPDPSLGMTLAYARAFENLSKRLLRQANGLVKHHDDMRHFKAEQAAKRAKKALKELPRKAGKTKKASKSLNK